MNFKIRFFELCVFKEWYSCWLSKGEGRKESAEPRWPGPGIWGSYWPVTSFITPSCIHYPFLLGHEVLPEDTYSDEL